MSLFYFYSHCQWVDLKMANLPWEAPSHWVRPNKTADDIGKTYGVIYINNVNRNFKKIMLLMQFYTKNNLLNICFLICWKIPKSENHMYLHANLGDKQGPFMHTSTFILQIFVQIGWDYFHNRHFIMKRVKHLHFLKIWDISFISLTDILPIAMSSWLGYIL